MDADVAHGTEPRTPQKVTRIREKNTASTDWYVGTLHLTKRIIKIGAGFVMILTGIAMLVLPGPGIVAIGLGLALLAGEFVWARRLLDHLKARATDLKG